MPPCSTVDVTPTRLSKAKVFLHVLKLFSVNLLRQTSSLLAYKSRDLGTVVIRLLKDFTSLHQPHSEELVGVKSALRTSGTLPVEMSAFYTLTCASCTQALNELWFSCAKTTSV